MNRFAQPRSTSLTRLAHTVLLVMASTWGAAAAAQAPVVPVGLVAVHTVGHGVEFEGVLQAVKQSTLSAQASGRITQWLVRAGDRVKAGQLLAVIDDRVPQAGVSQAQAQVAQADAQLAQAQAQYARTQDLQAKGFISQAALDVAASQFKSAQAGATGALAGQAQSQLAQGFTRLTAPYDGWVLSTHAETGDLAMPGAPLVTVYAPQPMRAVTYVPASRQAVATQAAQVEVRLPGGQWVTPVARATLPAADPVSQTVEWRLEMPASALPGMVPGQQVQVRFASAQAQRLTVPSQAVFRRGELSAVYVVREAPVTDKTGGVASSFVLRAVRLGSNHGTAGIEVLAGLSSGDRVALDPPRAGLAGARPAATQP